MIWRGLDTRHPPIKPVGNLVTRIDETKKKLKQHSLKTISGLTNGTI
jgi:hypothetical protein